MQKKSYYLIFFTLLIVSILISIAFKNFKQEATINSQKIELENKTKKEKVVVQLERALNIFEENNLEAQEITRSCLAQSKKTSDKYLKMRSLYTMGRVLINGDSIKKSQNYYIKALPLSIEIEDTWYRGEILYRTAKNQYRLNNTKLALETFNEALYYCQLSNNYKTIGATYSMIGTIFRINGVYNRAIEYFIKSRLNYSKANFSEGDAWVAYLLGQIHSDLRNTDKAMLYFQESLDKYQILANNDGNTNGLAICYEQIALLNLDLKNFDQASMYINMLLEIHTNNKFKYGASRGYNLSGKLKYLNGNYKEAKILLNKSIDIKNGSLNLHSIPNVYMHLGLCDIKTGKLDEGIKKMKQGLSIALTNNFKKNQLEIYSKLAETYLSVNNFKEAIYYKNKQIEIQDLILYGEADVKIDQLQAFYEIDEKNRQINELKKENEVNTLQIRQQRIYQVLMGLLILIAAIIAAIIYVFYNKLRHKNSELKTLNTTKNRLLSIISHDLRSPFNAILGFSDLLKTSAKELETSTIIKFSEHINSAAENTLTLLDNLLNWAKSQTGQITFNPSTLNLQPIIAQTIEILNPTAELKNIELNYIQPDNIEVYADEHMLKSILLNLVTNAVKFTNLNGSIVINVFQKNNSIEITISDNGIGMNNETRNKLFTLDAKGTTLGTAKEKGSGLGLVLCKELVEKHGGEIWVKSKQKKGTTFHFTLPNKTIKNKSTNTDSNTNLKK